MKVRLAEYRCPGALSHEMRPEMHPFLLMEPGPSPTQAVIPFPLCLVASAVWALVPAAAMAFSQKSPAVMITCSG